MLLHDMWPTGLSLDTTKGMVRSVGPGVGGQHEVLGKECTWRGGCIVVLSMVGIQMQEALHTVPGVFSCSTMARVASQ